MLTRIDLNSDMGEAVTAGGLAVEAAMMPLITSVSIACGGHAGSPDSMRRTAGLAARHGASLGAHPGWPDSAHFGRVERRVTAQEVTALILEQVGALAEILAGEGLALAHVKPHGALYTMAAKNPDVALALVEGVRRIDPALRLYALAGSALVDVARGAGLTVVKEAFADRAYRADGSLVPRSERGAVLTGDEAVRRQIRGIIEGAVASIDDVPVPIDAESICLHSDTPGAVALAQVVRRALGDAGVRLAPPLPSGGPTRR